MATDGRYVVAFSRVAGFGYFGVYGTIRSITAQLRHLSRKHHGEFRVDSLGIVFNNGSRRA